MSRAIKRTLALLALLLFLVLCAALLTLPVGAASVTIVGQNFVADTFCGVPAYYNEGEGSNTVWQCNEYINRFYREAYGLSIQAYSNTGLVMVSAGYDFAKTTTPKPGDILYATAEQRGRSTDHWAIVKSFSNGKATLIEQNWLWEGAYTINRTVEVPNDGFDIWTPVGLNGKADPELPSYLVDPPTTQPPTTQTTTTTRPTTVTTTATAAPTTTAATTTALATTTQPTTTTAATTTATTAATETTTEAAPVAATTWPSDAFDRDALESTQAGQASKARDKGMDYTGLYIILGVGATIVLALVIVTLVLVRKQKKG